MSEAEAELLAEELQRLDVDVEEIEVGGKAGPASEPQPWPVGVPVEAGSPAARYLARRGFTEPCKVAAARSGAVSTTTTPEQPMGPGLAAPAIRLLARGPNRCMSLSSRDTPISKR